MAKAILWLAWRDLLRYFRRPLGFGIAALYFFSQAVLFCLYVSKQVGPQPQMVAVCSYMFSSGFPMIILSMFLPALVMRAFAEERHLQTWQNLACMGLGEGVLIGGKFLSIVIQLSLWVLLTLAFPLSLIPYAEVDLMVIFTSFLGVFLVGVQWAALLSWLCCRTATMMSAYLLGVLVLIVMQFSFLLRVALPDKFYRPFFDAIDISAILSRLSQGLISLPDMLFLVFSTAIFLGLAVSRLRSERVQKTWLERLGRGFFVTGMFFALFLVMVISMNRPRQWNLATLPGETLSNEFVSLLKKVPDDVKITMVLPGQAQTPEYLIARAMISTFLERIRAAHGGLLIEELDPDVDLIEMERLMERMKNKGTLTSTRIGGLVLEYKGKTMTIPYHLLISLGTTTIANEAVRYIAAFHGEEQVGKHLTGLMRKGGSPTVLVIEGAGELNLAKKSRTGGSDLANMFLQMGFQFQVYKPGASEKPDLSAVDLILWIDPKEKVSEVGRAFASELLKEGVPVLAALGIDSLGKPAKNDKLFSDFGVEASGHIVVQNNAYKEFDFLTLPVDQYSSHPMLAGLEGATAIMTQCSVLETGIPVDPRLVSRPLIRSKKSSRIWGEANLEVMQTKKLPPPDDMDLSSPLHLAFAVEKQMAREKKPSLVIFAGRSLFENRFLNVGVSRNLVFRAVDWLCFSDADIVLPPKRLVNYRINLRSDSVLLFQVLVALIIPLLLMLTGVIVYFKTR